MKCGSGGPIDMAMRAEDDDEYSQRIASRAATHMASQVATSKRAAQFLDGDTGVRLGWLRWIRNKECLEVRS
jgi:hypothetical protein